MGDSCFCNCITLGWNGVFGHNDGYSHARRSIKGSIDPGDHLVSNKILSQKIAHWIGAQGQSNWSKIQKQHTLWRPPGEPQTQIKNNFLIETIRLAASVEGLNSSLAIAAGELWPKKCRLYSGRRMPCRNKLLTAVNDIDYCSKKAMITYKRPTTIGQKLTNYKDLAFNKTRKQTKGGSRPCEHCALCGCYGKNKKSMVPNVSQMLTRTKTLELNQCLTCADFCIWHLLRILAFWHLLRDLCDMSWTVCWSN